MENKDKTKQQLINELASTVELLQGEITERKKVETSLKLLERVVSITADHMSFIDKDYIYQVVNSSYLKAHKKNLKDIVGHSIIELLGEEVFKKNVKYNIDSCLNGEEINYQAWFGFPGLGQRFMDVFYYPYYEVNGDISGVVVSSHDITERRKAEELVKASLKEKEVLLQEIHHRAKNNMTVITSLLQLQSGHIEDENYKEIFKNSINRIKSMALIHEKLYKSKDLANVDFNDYLKDMINSMFMSYGLSSHKVALKTDIDDVALGVDIAIPCGLIINELVSNSLKYAFPEDRDAEMEISMHRNDKAEFELTVSDNGIGMPEDVDFRKTDSLGLTLVNALVKQLQGGIEVYKEKGTKFIITFKRIIV